MSEQEKTVQVRRLTPNDAVLYRTLRLEALENNPEAFASTHDAERQRPVGWFAESVERTAVFGAFRETTLVGIAGFYVQDGAKVAHKACSGECMFAPTREEAASGQDWLKRSLITVGGSSNWYS